MRPFSSVNQVNSLNCRQLRPIANWPSRHPLWTIVCGTGSPTRVGSSKCVPVLYRCRLQDLHTQGHGACCRSSACAPHSACGTPAAVLSCRARWDVMMRQCGSESSLATTQSIETSVKLLTVCHYSCFCRDTLMDSEAWPWRLCPKAGRPQSPIELSSISLTIQYGYIMSQPS